MSCSPHRFLKEPVGRMCVWPGTPTGQQEGRRRRRPAGEAVILTFLPGLILASESLHRAKEVLPAVGEASQVILNLTHVPFMSSTFLNMLVALNRLLGPEGKTLMLFGLHPDFVEIFKVMKIDSLFLIYEDERAALLAAKGCEPSQD
jgi:anti-sigma B factor antagonist